MKININKIKPYKIIQSSIGDLAVFSLTMSEKIKIEEKFDNKLDEISAYQYIVEFIKYACHKKDVLDDLLSKPPETTLSEEDAIRLNNDDLELIARIYIENNEYLYKKVIRETKKNEDGIDVTSTKYGEVIMPKNDNESYQAYLLRLETTYNKRISESFKKSFGNLNSFSKGIQESLRNTISFGEQLNKSLKAAQSIRIPTVEPFISTPKFKTENSIIQPAENKLIPFNEIAERLDQLVEINSDSTKFMLEANKLQTRIAEEIKESGNSSTRLSKINILIAIVVLILSILSFAFSIYSVHVSNKSNNINIERVIYELKSINETVKTDKEIFEKVSKRLNKLENQIDSISNSNAELEKGKMNIQTNKK